MEHTTVVLTQGSHGEVQVFSDDTKAGKMNIVVTHGKLIVSHTEVDSAFEGRGFAKLLLDQLVGYARENGLKIVPLCPYVHAQFKRHPAVYADVWLKE
jgi:uncharacterized protein